MSKRWKDVERRIGSMLGGVRNPITGRGDSADVESPLFHIEVKSRIRKSFPQWIRKGLDQARKSADISGDSRIPITVVHQVGGNYADAVVMIRMSDFQRMVTMVTEQDLSNVDGRRIMQMSDELYGFYVDYILAKAAKEQGKDLDKALEDDIWVDRTMDSEPSVQMANYFLELSYGVQDNELLFVISVCARLLHDVVHGLIDRDTYNNCMNMLEQSAEIDWEQVWAIVKQRGGE